MAMIAPDSQIAFDRQHISGKDGKADRTISANSAMRTKPASTIGEIGAGVGIAATASASGDSVGAGPMPARAGTQPVDDRRGALRADGWIGPDVGHDARQI